MSNGKGRSEAKSNMPVKADPVAMPAYMKDDAGQGLERLESGDYEMPRVKLLQGISPEVQASDRLRAGEYYHTLLEEPMGRDLPMVVLYVDKRFVLWRPREDGGGILARADDCVHWQPDHGSFTVKLSKDGSKKATWTLAKTVAESGLDQWGSYDPTDPNSPPAATMAFVLVCAFPTKPEMTPSVLLLQRTSIRAARKLMGKLKISQAPAYGQLFTLSSVIEQTGQNTYWTPKFISAGFVGDQEQYNTYKTLYEQFKKLGVKVRDIEAAQEDVSTGVANTSDTPTDPQY